MSHRGSTLQQPDEKFLEIAENINAQSTLHSSEWQLDSEQVSTLQTLTTTARAAYTANNNLATGTRLTSEAKKTAFSKLKKFLGTYIDYLEGNTRVPDEALAVMKLRPRHRHSSERIPPPSETPALKVVRQHDELTVYASRARFGHPTSTVAPDHIGGIKVRWKFEGEDTYRIVVSTRLNCTIFFDSKDESRRIVLSAAFVNPRLEEGPWSVDTTEVIG
jgi:hypothetical protein